MNRVTTAGQHRRRLRPRHERLRQAHRVDRHQPPRRRVAREGGARREALARLSPENPEYLPEPRAADLRRRSTATTRRRAISRPKIARDRRRSCSRRPKAAEDDRGRLHRHVRRLRGRREFERPVRVPRQSTGVASTLTVRTPDGSSSGWAGDEGADWTTIESERIADGRAARSARPGAARPRSSRARTRSVLEPTAVGMLMLRMMGAFDARSAEEGRSYFSKRGGGTLLGEKVFDERVTIVSDPAFTNGETAPFTGAGEPRSARRLGRERRREEPGVFAILGQPQGRPAEGRRCRTSSCPAATRRSTI